MKVLVTGGAGFIGSHIVDALLDRGYETHILDNLSTGREENIHPNATFHHLDLTDFDQVAALLKDQHFGVIIHHAAQLDVRKSVSDPAYDANVNIMGSLNLLQHAQPHGLEHFIFASSGGTVYGEQLDFPATERHPNDPISPYGVAKLTVEKYMHFFQYAYGIKQTALRYANIYGPRQNPHGEAGVVAIFCERMISGNPPIINGDGRQTRDYVMVKDVVNANMLALETGTSGAFNIGTGVETDVNEIFDTVNSYFGNRFDRNYGPAKVGEQQRSVLAHQLIKDKMGWEPRFDFQTGMTETLNWYKSLETA